MAVLGYRPTIDLASGLRETFDWYREHRAAF
jgi:nucleoside-diphosphate-sugar epimerase